MKVAVPLAKNILAPLGITAAASAASAIDARVQKTNWHQKKHGSGTTILIISNKEMNGIMKIVQALENSNISLKGASLSGNMLAGKRIVRAGYGNKKGKGMLRASYGSKNISESTSSFKKLWNSKISKWTMI